MHYHCRRIRQVPAGQRTLKSLLHVKCFTSVVEWAVTCRNALGDNIETFDLAGCIFVDGECVTKILDALEDKRFAKVFQEPPLSPVEDKTDDKELASSAEDKPVDKELAHAQVQLKKAQMFMQFFCEHQAMQTVS